MDDRTPHLNRMVAFLAGGLAGAGLALLLAPQSGRVTRERMGRKLRDSADSAREAKDRLTRRGKRIRDKVAHRMDEAASILASRRSAAGQAAGRREEDVASASKTHDGPGVG